MGKPALEPINVPIDETIRIWASLPPLDRDTYRRKAAERCVGKLKEARAVAIRFDKLAVNYLAMIKLAIVKLHFRALLATSDRPH